ncbi:hypothetical protein BY458DRAFT_515423 [Sporodiniella umbellata]|nr:hypothetical protein BY458DRAFT_515423 [Sporodiniella umbellata]
MFFSFLVSLCVPSCFTEAMRSPSFSSGNQLWLVAYSLIILQPSISVLYTRKYR